jgi:hypothetical protein
MTTTKTKKHTIAWCVSYLVGVIQLRSRELNREGIQKRREGVTEETDWRVLLSNRSPVQEQDGREEIGYRPAHRICTRRI